MDSGPGDNDFGLWGFMAADLGLQGTEFRVLWDFGFGCL